jgi:hypothetical protein
MGAGTIDYWAIASALGGLLTLAIMIWMAIAGKGLSYNAVLSS